MSKEHNIEMINDLVIRYKESSNEISKIIYKSEDITSMSMKEYELYIKNYTEKSNYPKLNNE